jgi:hypothetical protein
VADKEIRIRVGASADASVASVFNSVGEQAAKAEARVKKESQEAGGALGGNIKKGAETAARALNKLYDQLAKSRELKGPSLGHLKTFGRDAKRSFDSFSKDFWRTAREADRAASAIDTATKKAADATARNAARMAAVEESAAAKSAAASAKWRAKYFTGVEPGRLGRKGLVGATQSVFGVLGRGIGQAERLGMDLVRGAGIETDPGAYVKSFVDRQALASDIVHSGYIPGAKGANGVRQSASVVQQEAMATATKYAQDPTKVLEGLQKFVAITGDLETGRKVMGDMAKLTLATGSSMEDVVEAAGEISAKIGDIPNKAEVVHSVMRQIAGAGKMGAVEMRDFAGQLGKIAGFASRVGGDVDKNIGEMGLLMQLARQKGGAGSAAQAATSVGQFMETLATPAKLKKYEILTGRSAYTDPGRTKLASPETLILEALKASGGDAVKLHEIFGKSAARVTMGAANVYNAAGGGKAGEQALVAYFDKLRGSVLSLADENQAAAEKMDTAQARAQRFNNALQEVADATLQKVLPALDTLGPGLIEAAKGAGDALIALTPDIVTFGEFLGFFFAKKKPGANAEGQVQTALTLKNLSETGGAISVAELEKAQKLTAQSGQDVLNDREKLGKAQAAQAEGSGALTALEYGSPALALYRLFSDTSEAKAGRESAVSKAEADYQRDQENSIALKETLAQVQRMITAGAIKVEVVNNSKPPVQASHSGTMPVSRDN